MKNCSWLFLKLLLLCAFSNVTAQNEINSPYYIFPRCADRHIDLSKDWKLYGNQDTITNLMQLKDKDWVNVENPTSVQIALYKANKLPHPYVGLNSYQYKTVEQKAWYYKKDFNLTTKQAGSNYILSLDGIDYFAKIWFNGVLLGKHSGMFSSIGINVTKYIKENADNELIIQVLSANYKNQDYKPRNPDNIIRTWFFSNNDVTPFFHVGMWRGARIDILPSYHIERPFLFTKKIENNSATLGLQLELFSVKNSFDYSIHPWNNCMLATYNSPLSNQVVRNKKIQDGVNLILELTKDGKICYQKEFTPDMIEGKSWFETEFQIAQPELWFPNGMGDQNLYAAKLKLIVNKEVVDQINFDFGVRTIEQVRSAGLRTQDYWANWQFVINGQKQFIKGMNWMPIDALSDLTVDKYKWLISSAKNAGIQLLRVWGSGYVETKEFYDLCNKNGILVWQDFPIANFDTPNWKQESWEELVCQNIFRLRNEPSLAVWCGGNEFNPYSIRSAATIGILERNLHEFDPTRLFLRTSPDAGSMHSYPDFDPDWYKKFDLIPYVAETGIHCMTDTKNNREYINATELNDLSNISDTAFAKKHPDVIHHFAEYSPNRIPRMLSRASHFVDITSAAYDELAEATQVGAGEFYQIMSESFQKNYPVTTGLMPWVYNRPWPVMAAINLLDYSGQPSAPYYFLKRTYEKNRIMLDLPRLLWKPGEFIPVNAKILNLGQSKSYSAIIRIRIFDQNFREIYRQEKRQFVDSGSNVVEQKFDDFKIPNNIGNNFFFMIAESVDSTGKIISQADYWPRTIRQMEDEKFYSEFVSKPLPWPSLNNGARMKTVVMKNKTKLEISDLILAKFDGVNGEMMCKVKNAGNYPAFMCSVDFENIKRSFYCSDNFFWLSVGESKDIKITFQLREKIKDNLLMFSVKSWNSNIIVKKLSTKFSNK